MKIKGKFENEMFQQKFVNYFQPYSSFPTDETLQAYWYFHGKCLDELHPLVPPVPELPYHIHRVESSSVPLYSISKLEILLR